MSEAAPLTSYELTVDLFNKLLDDEKVINSFYLDIRNTYPDPASPKDLVKVAEFGKGLTKGLTDNYQKAKTIYNWFEKTLRTIMILMIRNIHFMTNTYHKDYQTLMHGLKQMSSLMPVQPVISAIGFIIHL